MASIRIHGSQMTFQAKYFHTSADNLDVSIPENRIPY